MRSLLGRALRSPLGAALLLVLASSPLLLLAMNAVVVGPSPQTIDFTYFGAAGAAMLTGRLGAVFADPAVQAGPFELVAPGAVALLGLAGRWPWIAYLTASAAAITFLAAIALFPGRDARPIARAAALAGALVVGLQCGVDAVVVGHPAEVVVPLLWVVAARLSWRGDPEIAAVVVALSAGFEVWGVLGAPLVLLAARPRLVRSAVAGSAALVMVFAPFVATGTFRMFGFAWPVSPSSVWYGVLPGAEGFPWPLRVIQAVVALAAGVLCVRLGRRDRLAAPAAILAISGARLSIDPVLEQYYWLVPSVAAIALAVEAVATRDLPLAAVAGLADLTAGATGLAPLRAVVLLAIAIGLVTAIRFAPRPRRLVADPAIVAAPDRVPV